MHSNTPSHCQLMQFLMHITPFNQRRSKVLFDPLALPQGIKAYACWVEGLPFPVLFFSKFGEFELFILDYLLAFR